jgi:DNA mismatch endonuclease (patch repair protein)
VADVHTIEVRSFNMSRIKSKDTKPELLVRRYLFSKGFRYRLHQKKMPGTPDIVFSKYKKVLFIHGCFWHGHEGCKYFIPPKTKTEWWLNKINGNKKRDIISMSELKKLGWNSLVVWQCELVPEKRQQTLEAVEKAIRD